MKHLLRFKTFLLLAIFSLLAGTSAWAQSDFSSTETSNVTLIKGTNASDCTVNGKDGIKVGTSSKGGDMSVTVPAGTTHLHLHAAAWNGVSGLSLNISGATASPSSISLTSNSGISNNSPFTLSGKASDYYFVIKLSNITAETTLKFTTSTTKRFVIWGVNAEEVSSGSNLSQSDFALTGAPVDLSFDLYNNSGAQVINYTTSSTGAVSIANSDYATFAINETNKTITVTPTAYTPTAQTITVNQAADDTYSAGSATFTLFVDDSTPSNGDWVETALTDISTGDVFVIVGNNGNNYALSNDNGTGGAPSAVGVTVSGGKITSKVNDNIKWNVTGDATNGYTFFPNGTTETWLYCTNTNNGVRVGTNDSKTFTVSTEGYLVHSGTSRYVGVYDSSDWRCYTSINKNIENQTFTFYKYDDGTTPSKPSPELAFSSATAEAAIGQPFTAPTLTTAAGFNGTVEYSSSNESVAQVMDTETGELRLISAGETVIKASFAGNDDFKSGSASYTLTVTDNRIPTTISQDPILLTLAEVGTLTKLAPVVKDENDNVVAYSYGQWPTEVSFEVVNDPNSLIGSLDNNSGDITINSVQGTATLKAYYNYYNVNSTYRPSECTFTITVLEPKDGIAEFCTLNNNESGTLKLTNAVVLYTHGNDMFVKDATGAMDFYSTSLSYNVGDVLNGTITGTYKLYNNMPELTTPISNNTLVATAGSAPTPDEITTSDAADNVCNLVKLSSAAVTENSGKFYVDNVQIYDKFKLGYTIEAGKTYDIVGIMIPYNSTYEICPTEAPVEVSTSTTPSITIDPATYTLDAKAGGGEIPVVSENLASDPQLEVLFYESDGTTSATYDWISAVINNNGNIYGQIEENTGDARTAYFKVHGVDANNNDVYSNLVIFTQSGPSIEFENPSIDIAASGESRTLGFDYAGVGSTADDFEVCFYESDGNTAATYDWITPSFKTESSKVKLDITVDANTGVARTAYFKVHAKNTTVYSNLYTVNQAAANVAHYYQKVTADADLADGQYLIVYEEGTVAFDGGLDALDAVNNTISVTIVGDKIEGNATTDAAAFTIDLTAGTLKSASGLYIGQTSDANGLADGATAYQNTLSIDADGNADVISSSAHLRYNATSGQDRFRYFKSASYTGQKAIQLYKRVEGAMPAASPALAVTPDVVTVPYTGGAESFTVTPSNVENAFGGYVTFYDPTDTETTVDQPDWIGISYDYSNMSLSYTITDENNTGAERTACFKYFIKCDNGEAMSNLVTVKQEAYVAPVASIAVDPIVVNATSVATEGTIAVTYNNITEVLAEAKFYEADGTTEATYDWIEAEIDANNNVYYVIDENNGVARTAYLKVYALDDDANDVYSELITINQAAYVAPALTQINLTKTLVFDTDCGLASGGYAVNDELTELSGTFEGDASATRFGGFVIKDSYINGGSIQMKANTGSIAFPSIESEYGFDVTVAYKTNDAIVYINGVSSTEASSGTANLIIATGSKYCQITSITLTPKTSEVPPTVDVEEPVITEVDGLVEIIPGADNVQVIYTTDGTDPTYEPLNGTVYTEPFNITVDTTIKAIGVDADGNASDVVEVAVTAPVVSGVKYYKVTSTDQLEEGVDYLLVYEGEAGEGAAAYGGLNSYTGYSIGKSVALKHIGGSVVTITDEEVVPVTLKSRSEDGTKWAMRDATGWIAAVNGYNNLHGDKTEDDAVWTFDFTADANKQIFQEFTATSTRYLQYNISSPRFAGYTGSQSAVCLYKAASYNVSVGATGYATLYYGTKNLVVPENVEAYTYTVNNGKLEESYLYSTNEVIPAGTGVVLKAPAGEYKFAVTTEAGLEDTDNLLFGFDTPSTTVAPAAGDYLFYLLGVDNGKVGFYWGNAKGAAFTSGAHKAYLAVPTEQASGLRGFSFDGSVVGINTIGVDMPEGNAYDLQGRRVQQFQKNGLYIVDGKKMLAK